jgi:hypothetical protein
MVERRAVGGSIPGRGYPMDTGDSFHGGKVSGSVKLITQLHLVPRSRTKKLCLLHTVHMEWCLFNLVQGQLCLTCYFMSLRVKSLPSAASTQTPSLCVFRKQETEFYARTKQQVQVSVWYDLHFEIAVRKTWHSELWKPPEHFLFGDNGFIEHLQIVTTGHYSAIANSHILQFTTKR